MPTRILVIGAGPNATGHARYYAASPRATLVAVADPDQARATALATETGCRAIADFRTALADVDAVVVSSPNFLHREHAEAVCAAGKHLYCEKPMGLDLAEARAIAAAVRRAGVASQVGFSPRNSGNLRRMARLAREGAFGRVLGVTSRRLMNGNAPGGGGWRADPGKSGGLLMEINIHELDWMMLCAGTVAAVSARGWAANPTHPRANDRVWITLHHTAGAVGIHEGGWSCPVANFYRCVEGADGGAQTDEWGGKLWRCRRLGDRVDEQPDPDFDLRGDWLDAIDGRKQPDAPADWALAVTAVAEACFTSIAAGGALTPVPSVES